MKPRPLYLLPYFVSFLILYGGAPASGQEEHLAEDIAAEAPSAPAQQEWTVIDSSYAVIYLHNGVDAKSAARKINVDFAGHDPVEKQIFLDNDSSGEKQLADKIDILVRKARKILDMYPGAFKVDIKIYNDQGTLNDAYKEIFEEEAGHKAFYVHKYHAIYISLDNLSESVLAHEIGHSIIDSYFTVLPPQKIRELLACYVDLHLRD